MKIYKAHKFRLELSRAQISFCNQTAGICRLLWNLGLEQRIGSWNWNRTSITNRIQQDELPGLKEAYPFFKEAIAQSLQKVLLDLDKSFKDFFQKKKGYPKFKSKWGKQSFHIPQNFDINQENNKIRLPKIGWIKYNPGHGKHKLKLDGLAKSLTISKEGKHWFCSILCEIEKEVKSNRGPEVGIDLGVIQHLTLSNGQVFNIKVIDKKEQNRIKYLQRSISRKKKGSKNRTRAKNKFKEFNLYLTRRRQNSIHNITKALSTSYSKIVMEDLLIKNMTRSAKGILKEPGIRVKQKSNLNRSILNIGWGEIQRQLGYKGLWYGSELILVNPQYTSQQCSSCGYTNKDNRKTQDKFICLVCGHSENADLNAAKNILNKSTDVGSVYDCGGLNLNPKKQEILKLVYSG